MDCERDRQVEEIFKYCDLERYLNNVWETPPPVQIMVTIVRGFFEWIPADGLIFGTDTWNLYECIFLMCSLSPKLIIL